MALAEQHTWRGYNLHTFHLLPCKLNFSHFTYFKILSLEWQPLTEDKWVQPNTKKCQVSQKGKATLQVVASTSKYHRRRTCPAKQVFACDLSVQLVSTWLSQQNGNCFFSPRQQSVQMFIFTETLETRGVQQEQWRAASAEGEDTLNGVSRQLALITGRQAAKVAIDWPLKQQYPKWCWERKCTAVPFADQLALAEEEKKKATGEGTHCQLKCPSQHERRKWATKQIRIPNMTAHTHCGAFCPPIAIHLVRDYYFLASL